jgi:acyl carrier protein
MANLDPIGDAGLETAQRLLKLVEQFVLESRPHGGLIVTADSSFERDLGLDSLARAELLLRAERAFGVSLPDRTLNIAETPRDLARLVLSAHGTPHAAADRSVKALHVEEARERRRSRPA